MEQRRKNRKEVEERRKQEESPKLKTSRKNPGNQGRKTSKKVEEALMVKRQQEGMKRMMDSWKPGTGTEVGRKKVTADKSEEEVVVDIDPVETKNKTRPAFRAALQMFTNKSNDGSRTCFEVWKAEQQSKVVKKRKKEQTDMVEEQMDIAAGKFKYMRNDLSSSERKENFKLKTKNITINSIDRLHGDTGNVGDAVQGEGGGVHGGNKEVTVENLTMQRAGLGQQTKSADRAAALSGKTGSGDSTIFCTVKPFICFDGASQ